MRFLIRDDDICFFTSPEELERIWGWYLNKDFGKLNLAVIPFAEATEFSKSAAGIYPIGRNEQLTGYIKQKIKDKKIEILLHGYSHAADSAAEKFEFTSLDKEKLYKKLGEAREYLEDLFKAKISTFVPPHNALSKPGLEAVAKSGLNILAATPLSPLKMEWGCQRLVFFLKRLFFSLKYKKVLKGKFVYPFLTRFSSHQQLDCLSLIPGVFNGEDLIAFYNIVKKNKGTFCLATHYWEIEHSEQEIIQGLVEYIRRDPDAKFVFASDILGVKK